MRHTIVHGIIFVLIVYPLGAMERRLLKNSDGDEKNYQLIYQLIKAVHRGDVYHVKKFVKQGADPQQPSREKPFLNAFAYAIECGKFGIVHYFIRAGCPIDQKIDYLDGCETVKVSPAEYAKQNGYRNLEQLLKCYEQLFFFAKENKAKDLEKLLIHNGHKLAINAVRYDRKTPLLVACLYGSQDVVRVLVEKGAGTDVQDGFGLTALYYSLMFSNYLSKEQMVNKKINCYQIVAHLFNGNANLTKTLSIARRKNNMALIAVLLEAAHVFYLDSDDNSMKQENL